MSKCNKICVNTGIFTAILHTKMVNKVCYYPGRGGGGGYSGPFWVGVCSLGFNNLALY